MGGEALSGGLKLSPESVQESPLAGETVTATLTRAPGSFQSEAHLNWIVSEARQVVDRAPES
jgi:phosphoglucomutase